MFFSGCKRDKVYQKSYERIQYSQIVSGTDLLNLERVYVMCHDTNNNNRGYISKFRLQRHLHQYVRYVYTCQCNDKWRNICYEYNTAYHHGPIEKVSFYDMGIESSTIPPIVVRCPYGQFLTQFRMMTKKYKDGSNMASYNYFYMCCKIQYVSKVPIKPQRDRVVFATKIDTGRAWFKINYKTSDREAQRAIIRRYDQYSKDNPPGTPYMKEGYKERHGVYWWHYTT